MKIEVLQGTIRNDSAVYGVGQVVDLPEKEGNALIREGVVKLAVDKSKVKPKPIKESAKTEIVKEEEELPEPSLDWTKTELVEAAKARGLGVEEKMTKSEILELLRG